MSFKSFHFKTIDGFQNQIELKQQTHFEKGKNLDEGKSLHIPQRMFIP